VSLVHSLTSTVYSSRDPRYLHSFPTRRSSDLFRLRRARAGTRNGALRRDRKRRPARYLASLLELVEEGDRVREEENRDDDGQARSEEHTSELQSPDQLVCRLLLGKKKKHKTR